MSVDYEKLMNLDYTAYERIQSFQEKLDEHNIRYPVIEVEKGYEDVPVVHVRAQDYVKGTVYMDQYRLENVTGEEFEEVMFDIWRETIEDIEQY